jgi:apolipoprotein N-acyltransferase
MASVARKLLLPVASAILFEAAFPPFNLALLVFACLIPWLWQLRQAGAKEAFWSGYLLGFLVVMAQMSFVEPLVWKWTGSFGLSLVPWIVCGFLGAFYFAFAGLLIRWCWLLHNGIWLIPIVWAGIEVIRSFIPGLAYPWFILATPLSIYPAIDQLAFFGTIYLVSAFVCLTNVAVCLLVSSGERGRSRAALAAVVVLSLVSVAWYSRPLNGHRMRIAIGQPGVDEAFGPTESRKAQIASAVDHLVERARNSRAALLVLPEGIAGGGEYPPQPPFHLASDMPLLFGGRRGSEVAYQTAFAYEKGRWTFADKSRLVVFGEYVPGRDYIPFLSSFKLPTGDLKPADRVSAIDIAGHRIGPMICFEGLFWDVAHAQSENGSQLIAIMSIDDWYMGTSAPDQLKMAAPWRAIETGLPVARSASLGYTVAVDAKGRSLGGVPVGGTDCLTIDFLIEDRPLRNPFRPLFPWLAALSPFTLLAWAIWSKTKKPLAIKQRGSQV